MTTSLRGLILAASVVLTSGPVLAESVLKNCFSGTSAQFFASELEDISKEKATPVLLLNDQREVVGVISVTPKRPRSESDKVKVVEVNKLELCSSLETSSFYYTEGLAENLLTWINAPENNIEITQDEGLIVLNAKVAKQESYATLVKVDFKAYDVFSEEEEVDEATRKHPDYIQDWGLPKGKGTFYFYLPKNWSK